MTDESKKKWQEWPNCECDTCGGWAVEVLTDSPEPGTAYDGDKVRCTECGHVGCVIVFDGGGEADTQWAPIETK